MSQNFKKITVCFLRKSVENPDQKKHYSISEMTYFRSIV